MLSLHDEKMEVTTQNVLRNLFRAICIIGAILLIGYCIREYALDQDVTHIEYKKFHEQPDDLYPSITLCFYRLQYNLLFLYYILHIIIAKQFLFPT